MTTSGRITIVLASFLLAVQEILYPVYFTLLFINNQSELNLFLFISDGVVPTRWVCHFMY